MVHTAGKPFLVSGARHVNFSVADIRPLGVGMSGGKR